MGWGGAGRGARAYELTRGLRVAPPHGVCPDQGHHLAIAEAHAAEDVPDVLNGPADRALVGVGQAPYTE